MVRKIQSVEGQKNKRFQTMSQMEPTRGPETVVNNIELGCLKLLIKAVLPATGCYICFIFLFIFFFQLMFISELLGRNVCPLRFAREARQSMEAKCINIFIFL